MYALHLFSLKPLLIRFTLTSRQSRMARQRLSGENPRAVSSWAFVCSIYMQNIFLCDSLRLDVLFTVARFCGETKIAKGKIQQYCKLACSLPNSKICVSVHAYVYEPFHNTVITTSYSVKRICPANCTQNLWDVQQIFQFKNNTVSRKRI